MAEKHNQELAKEARDAMNAFFNKWRKNIMRYNKNTALVMGDQWDEDDKSAFKRRNKKRLTFNKLYPIVNNVIGEYIKMTPDMQAIPISTDIENIQNDIEIAQNLFRTIAYSSDAKNHYRLVAKTAARGGYGAIRVCSERKSPDSFDKVLKVKSFSDPTCVFFDIHAKEPNKTDGMHCGYYTIMNRKQFEQKYKRVKLKAGSEYYISALNKSWYDDDAVMIVHFIKRIITKTTLYRIEGAQDVGLEDGNYLETELKDKYKLTKEQIKALPIVKNETTELTKIKHYKIAGDYELESSEIPCDELPIAFVDQESYELNGEQITRSLIQDAEDAQKFINFVGSQIAHLVKHQRHDRWQATPTMLKGFENDYTNSDDILGAVRYNSDKNDSVGRPTQLPPSLISPELIQQYQRALNDIHTSSGVFPTQIGNTGNEISGKAIDARADHASVSNVAFFVNVNAAIATIGRICLKMMPSYYDTHRVEPIQTSLGTIKSVEINKPDTYRIINNIKAVKFTLSVDAELSLEAQKQQALESLQMVLQANPGMFQLIADLYATNLPLANAMEIANRLKTIVPKEVIAAGKGEELPPKPPEPNPQEQLMQMKMQTEAGKLQNQQAANQVKAEELQVEREKLQQSAVQNLTNGEIAQLRAFAEVFTKLLDHHGKEQDRAASTTERLLQHQEFLSPTQKLLRGMYE